MGVVAVLAGSVLAIFQVLTLFAIIRDIKRMIVCTEKVDARVESVTEEEKEYKDSKTGKVKRKYSYRVTFRFEYNGQTYTSTHVYEKRCSYFKNQDTEIKINPRKPGESWTKGELKDLLSLFLLIPLYVFFDYLYIICVFE